MKKIGRNDACLCGSGKKYKVCCLHTIAEKKPTTDSRQALMQIALEHYQNGRLAQAEELYRKILLEPGHADILYVNACYNLGNLFVMQGKRHEAIVSYRQALLVQPDFVAAYNNLGIVLKNQGQFDEAAACFRQALVIKPDYAAAHSNLGNVLKELGQLDEAAASFRQALFIKPDYTAAHSNLLLTMQHMLTVTPETLFKEHVQYGERLEALVRHSRQPHQNSRDQERKLKVGYVSADFRNHSIAFFIEPILASHDRSQVEVYGYYNHTLHDGYTERIKASLDHWRVCAGMDDQQLTEQMIADGIDILVDLSGHTTNNRLPVFARKPAPVQMTWIGYIGTTGLSAMDYRITDAYMDPPELTERYHSEKLLRLPETGGAYQPAAVSPPVNSLPALTSGQLTFASLNNPAKLNQSVVDLWARILASLPHARLMLGNATKNTTRQRLIGMFNKAGVSTEQLVLQPRMSFEDYLKLHQQIDLALDPFPYNGGTTTLHSLWMGVPVITLAGEKMISRCGVAILSRVGLEECITNSDEEYLQCAIQFAENLPGLNLIRQSLRERMSTANCDPQNVTRHLEAAYRKAWRDWCQGGSKS